MNKRIKQPNFNEKSGSVGLTNLPSVEGIDYPIFCFKHLSRDYDFDACHQTSNKLLKSFVDRIKLLSGQSWSNIQFASKESFGSEKISVSSLNVKLPISITDEIESVLSFRFSGSSARIVGYRNGSIFHIYYIDTKLKTYKH